MKNKIKITKLLAKAICKHAQQLTTWKKNIYNIDQKTSFKTSPKHCAQKPMTQDTSHHSDSGDCA